MDTKNPEAEQRAEFAASIARSIAHVIDKRDRATVDKPSSEDVGEEIAVSLVAAMDRMIQSALRNSPIHAHAATHARLNDWDSEHREEYIKIFEAEYEHLRMANAPLEEISIHIKSLEKALEDEVFAKRAKIQGASAYRHDRESVASADELKAVREFDRGSALKEAQIKTEKRAAMTQAQKNMQELVNLGVKFDDAKNLLSGLGIGKVVKAKPKTREEIQAEEDAKFLE